MNLSGPMACRLQSVDSTGTSAASATQARTRVEQRQQDVLATPPRYPSPTPTKSASQTAAEDQQSSSLHTAQQAESANRTDLPSVSAQTLRPASSANGAKAAAADHVEMTLDISEASSSVQVLLSPTAAHPNNTHTRSFDPMPSGAASTSSPAAELKNDESTAAASDPSLHQGASGASSIEGSAPHTAQTEASTSATAASCTDVTELQRLLGEEQGRCAALMGKHTPALILLHSHQVGLLPLHHFLYMHQQALPTSVRQRCTYASHWCLQLFQTSSCACLLVKLGANNQWDVGT